MGKRGRPHLKDPVVRVTVSLTLPTLKKAKQIQSLQVLLMRREPHRFQSSRLFTLSGTVEQALMKQIAAFEKLYDLELRDDMTKEFLRNWVRRKLEHR